MIGGVDRQVTAMLNKRLSRSLKEDSCASEPSTSGEGHSRSTIESLCGLESESTTASVSSSDFEYEPSKSNYKEDN